MSATAPRSPRQSSTSAGIPPQPSRQRLAQLPAPQLPVLPEEKKAAVSSSSALYTSALSPSSSSQSSFLTAPRVSAPPSVSAVLSSRYDGRYAPALLCFVLLLVLGWYVMTESALLTGASAPLLPPASLAALNNASLTTAYFGPGSAASNATHRTRVVYCVVDGLRYDALLTNPALSAFVASLGSDALVQPLRAQLPTVSVPNWIALLTSTTPSMHGRTGNDVTSVVPFSSLFSSTAAQGRPNGMTASHWWAELMKPHLTPFTGDGAYSDEVEWGEAQYRRGESSAVRDAFATQRVVEVTRAQHRRDERDSRFDYELFLAYWEDVDAESHAWGGSSAQTAQAVTNVVAALRQTMEAVWAADQWSAAQGAGGVQWTTVFVITSDHGHVDVGGHGGDVDVLSTVPLLVYSNGSNIAGLTSHLPPVPSSYSPSTLDIATTVAALCGVPVPRQSQGMFLPAVLSAFVELGSRAWLHYFDLFMQKRALAVEALSVLGQEGMLDDAMTSIPPAPSAPSASNVSAALLELNGRIGGLLDVLARASDARLSRQLAMNWTLATLLVFGVLLPFLLWAFALRTFISVSVVFPQRVSSAFDRLSFIVRSFAVRLYRRVGGHAALPSIALLPPSSSTVRMNRVAAAVGCGLSGAWVLLLLFMVLVLFRFGYRPDAQWRWQFTLFNSPFDAYVLLFGACIGGGALLCVALHALAALVLGSAKVGDAIDAFVHHRPSPSRGQPLLTDGLLPSTSPPPRVLPYFLVLWSALWVCVVVVLFLYAQSYHCLLLPTLSTITAVTPAIWRARFQSLTFGFALLVPTAYATAAAAWMGWSTHHTLWRPTREKDHHSDEEEEEEEEEDECTAGADLEPWRRQKLSALRELAALKGARRNAQHDTN